MGERDYQDYSGMSDC